MKRGQVSTEFLLITGFVILFAMGVFGALQYSLSGLAEAREQQAMDQLAAYVENEVQLADSMGPGYRRNFSLPPYLAGHNYTVQVADSLDLVISYGDREHVTFLPAAVNGSVSKGRNTIANNGSIWINS